MAETKEEMPPTVIQSDKMFNSWKSTIKVCIVIMVCCVMYGFLHMYIKTVLLKNKRLHQIGLMVMETEKMMQHLNLLDQNLSDDIDELNDFFLDY